MACPTTTSSELRVAPTVAGGRHVSDGHTRSRVALELLNRRPMRDHRGFTLIEVLVVIVLVGVLAGLAISQYASYRTRSFDGKVAAAVRGVATSEEAYYAEKHTYAGDVDDLEQMAAGDVAIAITPGNSGTLATSFRVVGRHPGAARSFTWISDPAPGQRNLMEN
jgi:prepilin-type N-terminal cleavage/methylation domain-containing protein